MKPSEQWHICWVAALAAEARVLLDSYNFSRIKDQPFPLYYSQKHSMHLVISGIGKINSAAATAWLGAQLPPHSIWINFGTVGAKTAELGSSCWIHKITDRSNGRHYYPTVLPYWKSASLVCYDQAQHHPQQLVDMESSGFFPTASLFTHRELVQLYKLVSDNEQQPAQRLSTTAIAHLFTAGKSRLAADITELRHLAHSQLQAVVVLNAQLADWSATLQRQHHFSASHLVQLQELLRKWYIQREDSPLNHPAPNAASLLETLRAELVQQLHH